MLRPKLSYFCIFTVFLFSPLLAKAADPCAIEDRLCVLGTMEVEAAKIENLSWRDQTYREIAKTYALEGKTDKAIELIDRIETPDTKAMTIRGIGMMTAKLGLPKPEQDKVFAALREKAGKITHEPSFAIALTYIAMGQAFAKDNEGAWKTAAEMENASLRNKAYGETAEIQAENGDWVSAQKSIGFIGSDAYKNKAFETVAKILADKMMLKEAFECASGIANPYKKAEGLQYILDKQKPREILQK
jgi:hypothetical protein